MEKVSLDTLLSGLNLQILGIKAQIELFKLAGLDDDTTAQLEALTASLKKIIVERKNLERELKAKNAESQKTMRSLRAKVRKVQKVVKRAVPRAEWKDFGMTDKQ